MMDRARKSLSPTMNVNPIHEEAQVHLSCDDVHVD